MFETEEELLKLVNKDKIPVHVAIIMDGNGRWAKKMGLPRTEGHRKGISSVREVIDASIKTGVKILTLYAFSTENWTRPENEVSFLMNLFYTYLRKEEKKLQKENIRFNVIGDINNLSSKLQNRIIVLSKKTAKNERLLLNIALNYGGRQEIVEALKETIRKKQEINIPNISKNLYTGSIPDPDLLIRTSGEKRISNFMLWQIAYTELYFTDILWPDFKKIDFYKAIIDYQKRERRFGGVLK